MKTLLSKSPAARTVFVREVFRLETVRLETVRPLMHEAVNTNLSLARRAYDDPGLIINPETRMAWRPYRNLIEGGLDNRTPGKVTGWLRFFRWHTCPLKVSFDLIGDFHEDIRGTVIWLTNPDPIDRNPFEDRVGSYMDGFASVQRGEVGDITAGMPLGPWTDDLAHKLLMQ